MPKEAFELLLRDILLPKSNNSPDAPSPTIAPPAVDPLKALCYCESFLSGKPASRTKPFTASRAYLVAKSPEIAQTIIAKLNGFTVNGVILQAHFALVQRRLELYKLKNPIANSFLSDPVYLQFINPPPVARLPSAEAVAQAAGVGTATAVVIPPPALLKHFLKTQAKLNKPKKKKKKNSATTSATTTPKKKNKPKTANQKKATS